MKTKTCNPTIDKVIHKFIDVEDNVNIYSQVELRITNPQLKVDIKCTGNIYRKNRAYVFSVRLEDRKLAAEIHNHSNELIFGDTYDGPHLYKIEMCVNGRELTASRAMYHSTSIPEGFLEFISFSIELNYIDKSKQGNLAELVILDQLRFLGNSATTMIEESPYGFRRSGSKDVSKTICDKYEVIIKQYDGQTRINISRNDLAPITEFDIESILYSLSIVRAELLYPSVAIELLQNENNLFFTITADWLIDYKTPAFPPRYSISDLFWEYEPLFKVLIDRYSDDNREYYLSIVKVLTDSKSLIQTHLLSLCTAIESLTKPLNVSISDDKLQETEELAQLAIDAINKAIDASQFEEMNNRIIGCINSVKNTQSAQNKLKQLKNNREISKASYSAWQKIRNTLAHGAEVFNQDKYDIYHNSIKQLYVLLYQLFFLIVGYQGEYTDYNSIKDGRYGNRIFVKPGTNE